MLPQRPGHYLWHILDLNYLDVGSVHVMKDRPSHIDWLRERAKEGKNDFYLYQSDAGEWLTMYHDAHDHKPPCGEDGRPRVDGYRRYDFWDLIGDDGAPSPRLEEEPDAETMRLWPRRRRDHLNHPDDPPCSSR